MEGIRQALENRFVKAGTYVLLGALAFTTLTAEGCGDGTGIGSSSSDGGNGHNQAAGDQDDTPIHVEPTHKAADTRTDEEKKADGEEVAPKPVEIGCPGADHVDEGQKKVIHISAAGGSADISFDPSGKFPGRRMNVHYDNRHNFDRQDFVKINGDKNSRHVLFGDPDKKDPYLEATLVYSIDSAGSGAGIECVPRFLNGED